MTNSDTITLKCKRCLHVWDYSGGSKYYASCSYCRTSVNIEKNRLVRSEACAAKQENMNQRILLHNKLKLSDIKSSSNGAVN